MLDKIVPVYFVSMFPEDDDLEEEGASHVVDLN